ncbi:MAG: helix-turn-helix domain-containing protein [Clostridiaceae bacterium]|jgi:transcriptional regulator with XRE-family HTH domain|nr:helix-turn-helix domain-containing protein [Clostridiaceae bacterium]
MTFSEKVQEARYRLNLTQEQLAKELGVAFSTVNRWENGIYSATFLVRRKFEDYCKERGVVFDDGTTGDKK